GGGKRQGTGEHLVEGDAERVEVAAGVDRTVHSSSLLGRHVGKCASERLWRTGRLSLAGEARGDTEPSEPHLASRAVDKDVGRLDVLVDEAALMEFALSRGNTDGQPQEASHIHR